MPAQFTPYYRRIIEDIRGQIERGDLAPGAEIPSTRALAELHEVAPSTVRAAITLLIESGWLVGHQGRGVFVADKPPIGGA